jgi:hypothetical protein
MSAYATNIEEYHGLPTVSAAKLYLAGAEMGKGTQVEFVILALASRYATCLIA